MALGKVKWFNAGKGYGFITPSNGDPDIFVHFSEIQAEGFRTLSAEEQVEFEKGTNEKGPCAKKVRKL